VPGLPGPATAIKIMAVILVIGIIGLFNMAFSRQRRRRIREEMEKKTGAGGMKWKI
jgi:hypothetical protein